MNRHLGKVALLAVLYFVTGKLGLMLAVPPGYATVIWPASGIAIGMLIVHGWRLWPGVLLGSFVLNCHISNAYDFASGLDTDKTIIAFLIAMGSTLQALAGRWLVKCFLNLPLALTRFKDVLMLFATSGPVACLIAATVGVGTLYGFGAVPAEQVWNNWRTWWLGDTLGVLVFLPLVLIAPGNPHRLTWKGQSFGALPLMAMLTLMLPLGITFYAWKVTSENVYEVSQEKFKALANENEKALLYRMDSYNQALLGGAGFFQGSEHVSREEWKAYVNIINVRKEYPGINGIGYIEDVPSSKLEEFIKTTRADNAPGFIVHPESVNNSYFVIKYIEPVDINRQALGLNIAFEANRYEAATISRDSGRPAVTKRIPLVQDETRRPGFLLLHPFYKRDMPINTTAERRLAFRGWIYAPFMGHEFLKGLTQSQGDTLHLRVYDGNGEDLSNLIFRSDETDERAEPPHFRVSKEIDIMQQRWTLVWSSTKSFEQMEASNEPLFILVGGLLFSGLLAMFLLISASRADTVLWLAGEKIYVLPVFVFTLVAVGSYYLKEELTYREKHYIERLVDEKAKKIEVRLAAQVYDKFATLRRMAKRWEASGGTPFELWRRDASNHVRDLAGLKTMEWVDGTYHVRWVEPYKGNEKAVGLNIIFNEEREQALKDAAQRDSVTITPPLDLVQGYKAFIAYAPIHIDQKFDGFIAGIFSIDELLASVLANEITDSYGISFFHNDKEFFRIEQKNSTLDEQFVSEKNFRMYDKLWAMKLTPTRQFVRSNLTPLPTIIFIAGLLIAVFIALTVRYTLISRLKTTQLVERQAELKASEETFRSAMESASIGMALVTLDGKWMQVNDALCAMLGYAREELQAIDFQTVTHPDDLKGDLEQVRRLLAGEINDYQLEKRYIHRDGHIIWILLAVSLVRDDDGSPRHFVAQIQDITARREIDRMKKEFISTVSHELRTPLTSIRGALGLMEGGAVGELSAKAMNLVQIAHKNSQRLVHIINDILDVEKIESGKLQVNVRNIAVRPFLEQALEANEGYGEKFQVQFTLESAPNINIAADPDRLMQVMANLLSNAAKFSPRGSEVIIRAYEVDKDVRFEVTDKGSGIPEEFRSHIFGKFAQADSSDTRHHEGTGLGLNISKQLIELMDGHIGFETISGKGTTFYFHLPRAHQEYAMLAENSCYRLLLVEDDDSIVTFLQALLEQAGFMVDVAHNIVEASEKLASNYYAAMILDLMLPLGDGLEFLQELRGKPATANLPVLVVSAKADEAKEKADQNLKVADWLTKPIDADKLVQSLSHIMSGGEYTLPQVLHVEDDRDLTHVLAEALHEKAMLVSAPTIMAARHYLNLRHFDLVLLDLAMPDGSGEELLNMVHGIPVITLSANEPPVEMQRRVAASLVKSRVSEADIVNKILSFLPYRGIERRGK